VQPGQPPVLRANVWRARRAVACAVGCCAAVVEQLEAARADDLDEMQRLQGGKVRGRRVSWAQLQPGKQQEGK
jgi:hypothetical protein